MWHPELDVVRADGSDDPGGGCFDGVPDPRPSGLSVSPDPEFAGTASRNPH
jgi:hypothetical protein